MQVKGVLKEEWGKLTDDHLDTIAGKRDRLAGRLRKLYGLSTDEAEQQLRAFERRYRDWDPETTTASHY